MYPFIDTQTRPVWDCLKNADQARGGARGGIDLSKVCMYL